MENLKRDPHADFRAAFENIKRPGAADLLAWLEGTDFFEAPASTKYHGAHRCGLLIHSLNVYHRLREITARDIVGHPVEGEFNLEDKLEETVAILGLLHDVCKADVYQKETRRRRNPDSGAWEDYTAYVFKDPFPLGHGEKSVYQISKYITLTDEEALAIRWHMGAYDEAAKGGAYAMVDAMSMTPWVWRLQEADMCATWINEREG